MLRGVQRSVRWGSFHEPCTAITVLIPCHSEAQALADCLDQYAELVKTNPRIKLVALLTHRAGGEDVAAVHRVAESRVAQLAGALSIVECSLACTNKARKLEFFFRSQPKEATDSDEAVVVTDVDARTASLLGLGCSADPLVCQAVPVIIPLDPRCSFLACALALAQAERSMMEKWALTTWNGSDRPRPFLLGMMGACMALNHAAIAAIGAWPTDSDDIRVGYRADLLGVERRFWPSRFTVGAALSLTQWMEQNLRIAAGVYSRWAELRRAGFSWSRLGRILGSGIFDWLPCLRLCALFAVILSATDDLALLLVAIAAIALQIGLQWVIYASMSNSTGRAASRGFAAAAVGAFVWPLLRLSVGLLWHITPKSQRARLLGGVTAK